MTLSALISSVLVVVAILIPLLVIGGLAVNQLLALRDYLQERFKDGFDLTTVESLRPTSQWVARRFGLELTDVAAWIAQHSDEFGPLIAERSLAIAANVTGVVVSFVFTMFAMLLLFRDWERIVGKIPDLLPFERIQSETHGRSYSGRHLCERLWFRIALIQGALCGIMFWVLGIPSAALWGMVTVLTSVLPLIGAAAVWIPGTLYLLVIGHWAQAIVLAVWGTAVISGVDNFLRPKLVGDRVGLSELVIFFAVLGGLQVFGVLGIVMGPVVFAIAISIFDVLSEGNTTSAAVGSTGVIDPQG